MSEPLASKAEDGQTQTALSLVLDEIEQADGWTLTLLLETNAALVKALRRAIGIIEEEFGPRSDTSLHVVRREITTLLTSPAEIPPARPAITEEEDKGKPETDVNAGNASKAATTVILRDALRVLLWMPGWPNQEVSELKQQTGVSNSTDDAELERVKRAVIKQIQGLLSEHGGGSPAEGVSSLNPVSEPEPSDTERERSGGLCDTTITQRVAVKKCTCPTYPENLGPCRAFKLGANGQCVFCDHTKECHSKARAAMKGKP